MEKRMKKVVLVSLSVVMLNLAGCASLLTDKEQKINLSTTTGQPVSVQVDGKTFDGPGVITVAKSKEKSKVITSTTEGCAKETVLTREIEPTFWVNILSGGAFGSTTDMATEKMWKYQDSITVTCSK
jgi:hypothetical protein